MMPKSARKLNYDNLSHGLELKLASAGADETASRFLLTAATSFEENTQVDLTNAVMELGAHGLAPDEGRKLVEAIVARPPTDPKWELIREIGERVGWHPEALRLAAIEGREIGWQGILDELRAGRMPWNDVRRLVMRQWARLQAAEREWLSALIRRPASVTWLPMDDAARLWQIERPVAERRLWILQYEGLVESLHSGQAQQDQGRIARVAHPTFAQLTSR